MNKLLPWLFCLVGCVADGVPAVQAPLTAPGTRVIDACLEEGSDLGSKINAAATRLGPGQGEIVVGCPGNIATQVLVGDNHNLTFGPGDFTSTVPGPTVLMGSNSAVSGSGWATTLYESSTANADGVVVVTTAKAKEDGGNIAGYNISVRNLRIAGTANRLGDGARSSVSLGNIQNAVVENVFVDSTHGIGIQIGGSAYFPPHNHADGAIVKNCVFDNIWAVSLAAVNAKNFIFTGNRFRRGPANSNTAYIDLEPNTNFDVLERFTVNDNILDASGADGTRWGIMVQNGFGIAYGPGSVSNNIVVGGDGITPGHICQTARAIEVSGSDVIVANNSIRYYCSTGINLTPTSSRVLVSGNSIRFTGNHGVVVNGKHENVIGNSIDGSDPLPGSDASYKIDVFEGSTGFENVVTGNVLNSYRNPGSSSWNGGWISLHPGTRSVASDNYVDVTRLSSRGSEIQIATTVAGDYQVGVNDRTLIATGPATIQLPSAIQESRNWLSPSSMSGGATGRRLTVKAGPESSLTLNAPLGQVLDGQGQLILIPGQALELVSDGSSWRVLNGWQP